MTRGRKLGATAAVGAVISLICVAPALAGTRYAGPSGTGSEPCDQIADPCSLQQAVEGTSPSDVNDGDEVIVLPGTYNETDELDAFDAIDLHGQDGQPPPTINTSAAFGLYVFNTATIRRLDIEHSGTGFALSTAISTAGTATVDHVIARSSGGTACAIMKTTATDSVCWNSRTTNFGTALACQMPGSFGTGTDTLRNVTAVATGPSAYGIYDTAGGGDSCTIDAKSVIARGTSGGYDVYASVSSGAGSAIVTLDHSNFENTLDVDGTGTASITDPSTNGNQTGVPAFVDASGGDFHQLTTSTSTIDLGATDGSSGTNDIDGDPRTVGAAPDIGADEYVPPTPPPSGGGGGEGGGGGGAAPDVTAPDTGLGKHPKKKTTSRKAKFTFSSSEPGSSFECKLDRKPFKACSSPFSRRVKSGKHNFQIEAIDAAGNVDPTPARFKWKVLAP